MALCFCLEVWKQIGKLQTRFYSHLHVQRNNNMLNDLAAGDYRVCHLIMFINNYEAAYNVERKPLFVATSLF